MPRPRGPMTVRELLQGVTELHKSGAISLDTPIIYSQDDEGNNYQGCVFAPSVMEFTQEPEYGKYLAPEDIYEEAVGSKTGKPFTYLCIN